MDKEQIESCENCVYDRAHSRLCDSCGDYYPSQFRAADFVSCCANCTKLETENKKLKERQDKIRSMLTAAKNVGFCQTKRDKHVSCSLDKIYEYAVGDDSDVL
jgi:hypothetical protein